MKSGIRDISTGIVLIGIALFGYLTANQFSGSDAPYGPDFFPKLVLILLGVCSLVLFVKGIMDMKTKQRVSRLQLDKGLIVSIVLYVILLIVYINLFFVTGFIISTIIFLLIGQYLFGVRKWLRLIVIAIIVPFILYYLFTVLFNIPLP